MFDRAERPWAADEPTRGLLRALGNKVRAGRLEKGLSQTEFGKLANLNRSYIGEVEQGKRNVSLIILADLAKAMEITLAQLCEEWQDSGSIH